MNLQFGFEPVNFITLVIRNFIQKLKIPGCMVAHVSSSSTQEGKQVDLGEFRPLWLT